MSGLMSGRVVLDHSALASAVRPAARREASDSLLVAPLRELHVLEHQRLLVEIGLLPSPAYSQAATYEKFSSSRSASPSGVWLSSRKWPPHDSVRCSASMHISSPSSRKSATRPAFSSAWLSSTSLPGTLTLRQNSSRSSGIRSQRLLKPGLVARHAAVVPHDLPELAMERVDRALSVDRSKLLRPLGDLRSRLRETP